MKSIKISESTIELWGTLQSTERHSDILLLKVTFCSLLVRYNLNQFKATPRTPYIFTQCNRFSCFTQSKALEQSRNIIVKRLSVLCLGYPTYFEECLNLHLTVTCSFLDPTCDGFYNSK